jgi:hypothetical protein
MKRNKINKPSLGLGLLFFFFFLKKKASHTLLGVSHTMHLGLARGFWFVQSAQAHAPGGGGGAAPHTGHTGLPTGYKKVQ